MRVDFVEGASAHRRKFGGGSGQMIASGRRPARHPSAGPGRHGRPGPDGFVLASLGCEVTLVERQPLIAPCSRMAWARPARSRRGADRRADASARRQLGGLMRVWDGEAPQESTSTRCFHRDRAHW
ncbi:class I SAM-dependent methyltransferase [Pseudomonas aeruginosa]